MPLPASSFNTGQLAPFSTLISSSTVMRSPKALVLFKGTSSDPVEELVLAFCVLFLLQMGHRGSFEKCVKGVVRVLYTCLVVVFLLLAFLSLADNIL